jgi:hypothetical protein
MRSLAVALAVVAVSATAAAAADPRSEKVRLQPADVALAKRSVLRQSDVGPEWIRVPTSKRDDSQFSCDGFEPDFSAFTITGEAYASFRLETPAGGSQIDSMVAVFRTKAQAVGDFQLGAKPKLAACLAGELRRAFDRYPPGVRGRVVSSKMVAGPALGERSATYAITAELSGNGMSVRVFVDVMIVQRGRSMAALVFTGVGNRIPSREYYASSITDRLR